jgi:hypothetical protein
LFKVSNSFVRGDQKADSGHIHYTQVLEAASKKFDKSNPGKNAKTQTLNTVPSTHGDLRNVFEMLELERAGEGVEASPRRVTMKSRLPRRVVAKYDLGRGRGELESPRRPRGHG